MKIANEAEKKNVETRNFEEFGELEWLEPEEYYAGGWSPFDYGDDYDIVINRERTELRYTNI